jgi:uncharacterized protein HemX
MGASAAPGPTTDATKDRPSEVQGTTGDLDTLKRQVEEMQKRLDRITGSDPKTG